MLSKHSVPLPVSVAGLRSLLDSSDGKSSGESEMLVMVRDAVETNVASGNSWRSGGRDFLVSRESGDRAVIIQRTQTLQSTDASPYTFLQALFGHEYPVGLLDEEKILPLRTDITAVGICRTKNGMAEIKSCKDLPYFLSDLTKDETIVDLAFKTGVLFWSGVVFGSLSIGVLGYAMCRNWNRWKSWRQQRQTEQRANVVDHDLDQIASEDETEDVPDDQLCVICLVRRTHSAFIPCGHLVCCQRSALSVVREVAPKCPVCRQQIQKSVRIFGS